MGSAQLSIDAKLKGSLGVLNKWDDTMRKLAGNKKLTSMQVFEIRKEAWRQVTTEALHKIRVMARKIDQKKKEIEYNVQDKEHVTEEET